MKINFKQPKYILPLILLPFFCLFFFVYTSFKTSSKPVVKQEPGFNSTVGQVSGDVQKKQLEDKLQAYQNTYKQSDGMTAVTALSPEKTSNPSFQVTAADRQRKLLDSLNQVMKARTTTTGTVSNNDRDMAAALNNLNRHRQEKPAAPPKQPDPMETFRQQMAYLDSMNRANDPAVKAERQKKEALAKTENLKANQPRLSVHKIAADTLGFNTVMPPEENNLIRVIIDENLTGYAGSRIRLRLLDDIQAGHFLIPKNSYLFALISGFSGQRVTLSVTSILYGDKILPVKLDVYDLDGLQGLYVPESAFRDFTKDLGQNSVQGMTQEKKRTGSVASQFMMSGVSKLFESTSSAIAGIIRKNKAKIKFNSYLYLIDTEALQNAQHNY